MVRASARNGPRLERSGSHSVHRKSSLIRRPEARSIIDALTVKDLMHATLHWRSFSRIDLVFEPQA